MVVCIAMHGPLFPINLKSTVSPFPVSLLSLIKVHCINPLATLWACLHFGLDCYVLWGRGIWGMLYAYTALFTPYAVNQRFFLVVSCAYWVNRTSEHYDKSDTIADYSARLRAIEGSWCFWMYYRRCQEDGKCNGWKLPDTEEIWPAALLGLIPTRQGMERALWVWAKCANYYLHHPVFVLLFTLDYVCTIRPF